MKKLIAIILVTMSMATPALRPILRNRQQVRILGPGARRHDRASARPFKSPLSWRTVLCDVAARQLYGGHFNYDNTGGGSPGYNQLLMTW